MDTSCTAGTGWTPTASTTRSPWPSWAITSRSTLTPITRATVNGCNGPTSDGPARARGAPQPGLVSHHLVRDREQDGLEFGVGLDGGPPAFAAEPGLPVAAERRVRLQLVPVDTDRARPDGLGHPERPLDVVGPDRGGEAVLGVVGDPD